MSVFFLSINWHQLTIHHLVNELFVYCHTDKVGGLFISEEIPSEMEIAPRYTLPVDTVCTVYTNQTDVHCLNSSMYAYMPGWQKFHGSTGATLLYAAKEG